MNKKPENNKIFQSQINLKTAKEIAELIEQIDNKIIQLLNCSSEDFLNLNTYLKDYHTKVTQLANNLENILETITDKINREHVKSLKSLHSQLHSHWDKHISKENHASVKSLISQIKDAVVPLNNLRQDLKSLKLLFTNLSLEYKSSPELHKEVQKAIESINEVFVQLDSKQPVIGMLVQKGEMMFSDHLLEKAEIIENYLLTFFQEMDAMFAQVEINLRTLKDYQDRNKLHVSNIITNLQYHDIIRQKIEHIQEIHKEIFAELNEISTSNEQQFSSKTDFFTKIKDIAGLQAAQLLHTNQEYQKAINIITTSLSELTENLSYLTRLCHGNDTNQNCDPGQHFDHINKIHLLMKELPDPAKSFVEFTGECKKINNYRPIYQDISNIINVIEGKFSEISSDHHQFFTLISNLRGTLQQNEDLLGKIEVCLEELNGSTKNIKLRDSSQQFDEFKIIIQETCNSLNTVHEGIKSKINENHSISEESTQDHLNSSDTVKYYDLFERVIEEIIDHLNSINLKLENGEESEKDKMKNLEYLKNKYTTESEHFIHENILNDNDSVKIESNSEEEDDDNFELF